MIYMTNFLNVNVSTKLFSWLFIFPLTVLLLQSCEKPEDLGYDIVAVPGEVLNVAFVDTVTVKFESFLVDSVASKSLSSHLLGSMNDEIFGTSSASIYTQVRMISSNLDFGTNPVCDSIVLSFDYSSLYGDSNTVHHIKVYELDQDIYLDSTYYSNQNKTIKYPALFDQEIPFRFKDSVPLFDDGSMSPPHLRLKLSQSFGNLIISKSGQTELSDNTEFLKFLKGFYVTVDPKGQGGSLAGLSLLSNFSNLCLYYHNDTDTSEEYFLINSNCARFSNFNHHNYLGSDLTFYNQVVKGNSSLQSTQFYQQPMASVRTRITFPYLDELAKHGTQRALHQAILVLNVADYVDTVLYPLPLSLSIVGEDSLGNLLNLIDYYEGATYFGGNLNRSNREYTFTLTRTIQDMLLGISEYKSLVLIISGEAIHPKRLVLNSFNSPSRKSRLKLIYTDVNTN